MNSPPRSLEELLRDFNKLPAGGDAEAAVEANLWAKRFREHLREEEKGAERKGR